MCERRECISVLWQMVHNESPIEIHNEDVFLIITEKHKDMTAKGRSIFSFQVIVIQAS